MNLIVAWKRTVNIIVTVLEINDVSSVWERISYIRLLKSPTSQYACLHSNTEWLTMYRFQWNFHTNSKYQYFIQLIISKVLQVWLLSMYIGSRFFSVYSKYGAQSHVYNQNLNFLFIVGRQTVCFLSHNLKFSIHGYQHYSIISYL